MVKLNKKMRKYIWIINIWPLGLYTLIQSLLKNPVFIEMKNVYLLVASNKKVTTVEQWIRVYRISKLYYHE